MPLKKTRKPRTKARCRADVSTNVGTLMAEGYPQKQAVAIALSTARKAGCRLPDTRGRSGGRETWPDGRWKPVAGDRVYQFARGTGGGRAKIVGEVVLTKKNTPAIKILHTEDTFGGRGRAPTNRLQQVTDDWIVEGDPVVEAARKRAIDEKQRAEAQRREQESSAADLVERKARALGLAPISARDLRIGAHVYTITAEGDQADVSKRRVTSLLGPYSREHGGFPQVQDVAQAESVLFDDDTTDSVEHLLHPTADEYPSWVQAGRAAGRAMSDEDFKQRYMITTTKGVIYGYSDMLKYALAVARKSPLPVQTSAGTVALRSLPDLRERVVALLNDDAFLRRRAGEVPARIASAIEDEISSRSFAGSAAGKAPRPPKGTPTTGDLYCLHVELAAHKQRTGHAEPLYAFAATCVGAMRKLLKAGYLAPALGAPRGHWVLTGQGLAAYEGWRERHAGFYDIPKDYRRDEGAPGRDGGLSLLLVAGVVVGAILLLRPVFRDSFERHKWSMQNDPAYRRSHEAMEYAAGARGVVDILTNDGRAAGRRAPRQKVLDTLEEHFSKYSRYYRGVDRDKMYMVAVEMLDQGASATDALALSHGLAHDLIAQRRTERLSPKATAKAILSGKVQICKLPVKS